MQLSPERPQHYRSVFLSDFHIGAKSFDAAALVSFLRSFECEKLYLVGDIIDGWKLNKRWYWTEDCNRIFDELAAKIDKGTKIIFLPGNHDEEVRNISSRKRQRFAQQLGITITDKIIHEAADGRRYLVLHGDQFDRKILKGPLSQWSDRIYDAVMDFLGGHAPPTIMIKGKRRRFSLAKSLGKHGQWALHLLNNFESAVHKMVHDKGVDGLICGHTHIPTIKPIKDILYANSGSWLRTGHTALIETHYGDLSLLDWPASHESHATADNLFHDTRDFQISPDRQRYRPTSMKVVRTIQKIWPVQAAEKASITEPLEWIEIHKRDDVIFKRFAGLKSYALCKPNIAGVFSSRHVISPVLSTLLTYKPRPETAEDLTGPLNMYDTFLSPPQHSTLEISGEQA